MVLQGFYYDAFYGELGLNEDHFKQIEARALKAVAVLLIFLNERLLASDCFIYGHIKPVSMFIWCLYSNFIFHVPELHVELVHIVTLLD